MIDWRTIETEYVTTDISHRQLAEKYGIGRSRLSQYASKEKWKEKRDKHRARTVSKAVNAIGTKQAERTVKLLGASDLLIDKVKILLEDGAEQTMDISIMKDVSVILKNLKDIQMIKSEKDLEEQEARIAKLRREAEKEEDTDTEVTITFGTEGKSKWAE